MLLIASSQEWLQTVLSDFDAFLLDHASCEKKASSMAMSMIAHYPDRVEIIEALTALAVEELTHFRQVVKIILARGLCLAQDEKDPYINQLRKKLRAESEDYFLDRLLLASVIEARGHERFGMIAEALPEGELKTFYDNITRSEGRHLDLFIDLAGHYFTPSVIEARLKQWLEMEAEIVAGLPLRATLH